MKRDQKANFDDVKLPEENIIRSLCNNEYKIEVTQGDRIREGDTRENKSKEHKMRIRKPLHEAKLKGGNINEAIYT